MERRNRWHNWKQALEDENMPAKETIKLLEEKKGFLIQQLEKIDVLLAELKK